MMDTETLRLALKQVIDPELGINIIDLGLVYRLDISEQHVEIDLTMTSPACPMGELIVDDVEDKLRAILPASTALEVSLVWEPPWSPERMSPDARRWLGVE
ncbi:MAG: metal-sulfur cluster assembly factor [Betaproteobacteria bacterium]|nr:metal-sulfur cluster assembly factor [Betaproteobacteria bacterium]